MTKTFNIPVTILRMGFGRNMCAIPRRIEWEGRTIDFVDNGLRMTIRRGNSLAQILSLSDGTRTFRLRSDNHGGSWTLLGIH
jgi:hypothetical protein